MKNYFKTLILIYFFVQSINVSSQINLNLQSGIFGNSRVIVHPYQTTSSSSFFPHFQIEIEYKISENLNIGILYKNQNKGSWRWLLNNELNWKSQSNYYGINSNIDVWIFGRSNYLQISPFVAYGNQKVNVDFKEIPFSLGFSSSSIDSIGFTDNFKLFQFGLNVVVCKEVIKSDALPGFTYKWGVNINKEYIIDGKREFSYSTFPNSSEYYDFNYKGKFSYTLIFSIGFTLIGKKRFHKS